MKRRTALILQMARKRQMIEKGVTEAPGPSHRDEWRIVSPDPSPRDEWRIVPPVSPTAIGSTSTVLGTQEWTETGIPETSETGVTKVNKTSTSITKINGNKISEENESSVTKMNENGVNEENEADVTKINENEVTEENETAVTKMNENGVNELDKTGRDSDGAPDPFAASDGEENDPSYNPDNEMSNNNILSLPDAKKPKLLTKKPKKENQRKTRKHLRQLGAK
ncbi:hypothetical protein HNY73_017706 [Argiope bruennichi]|uniref:Uncharacterized protein n=1 Tax=Argiope bruennichi TaxID=94029 RepID=A0A8T0EFD8_ARGBR|nr:hypothetical protein HNY73_017706 [Argiope bruennichi]